MMKFRGNSFRLHSPALCLIKDISLIFRRDIGTLVGSIKKMCDHLGKVNYIEKKNHDKPWQLRHVESNTEITIREKSLKKRFIVLTWILDESEETS